MMSFLKNIRDIKKLSFSDYPDAIKQKIRDYAVSRADRHMIIYGIDLNDLDPEQYEHLVYNEEQKIINNLKSKSMSAILMLTLGINI